MTPTPSPPFLPSVLLPLCLPLFQFGLVYNLWSEHAVVVKREFCQNSCWDTVFKAGYETGAGSYKHVYFNSTWQAGAMWVLTLLSAIALYEAGKYLVSLHTEGRLRWRMGLLFLAAVYPHYYAYWTIWGYLNDDFYEQVCHQLLFTVTELASTVAVLQLADKNLQASPHRLMVVVGIAGGHVLASAWDQFVSNVMKGEGGVHQVLRDLGFMVPDLLHILLPIQELGQYAKERRVRASYLVSDRLALVTASTAVSVWLLSLCL